MNTPICLVDNTRSRSSGVKRRNAANGPPIIPGPWIMAHRVPGKLNDFASVSTIELAATSLLIWVTVHSKAMQQKPSRLHARVQRRPEGRAELPPSAGRPWVHC